MSNFAWLAHPLWVNLLLFVPAAAYLRWRRAGLNISRGVLFVSFIYALAMGYWEAATVVYLRSIGAFLSIKDVISEKLVDQLIHLPSRLGDPGLAVVQLPGLITEIEIAREVATILILLAVTLLAVRPAKERFALFLWMFAIWDTVYYLGLWAIIGWPSSLTTPDVLFLIPVPWYSQVWFPMLVSMLTMLAVWLAARKNFKRV